MMHVFRGLLGYVILLLGTILLTSVNLGVIGGSDDACNSTTDCGTGFTCGATNICVPIPSSSLPSTSVSIKSTTASQKASSSSSTADTNSTSASSGSTTPITPTCPKQEECGSFSGSSFVGGIILGSGVVIMTAIIYKVWFSRKDNNQYGTF